MPIPTPVQHGLDQSALQLKQVFSGIQEGKLVPSAMSPSETLDHLGACCLAIEAAVAGEEFDWETPVSLGGSYEAYEAMRAKAVEKLGSVDDEKATHLAMDYLVLHDAYHVGQLAQYRVATEPDWNPYSIYG